MFGEKYINNTLLIVAINVDKTPISKHRYEKLSTGNEQPRMQTEVYYSRWYRRFNQQLVKKLQP